MMDFLRRLWGLFRKRNYDAAKSDRLSGNWTPVGQVSAEETDAPYRNTLLIRARDLERNSDIVEAAVNGIIRNAVGSRGIIPQAHAVTASGGENERLNDQLEALWAEWSRHENCDASGMSTFAEIQAMALRRRIVDGEIFIRKITTKDRIPLRLQVLEADQLDTYRSGANIYNGIEVDEYLRPIAYWFHREPIASYRSRADSVRVPADEVIHLFSRKRPSQVHGVSELSIVMSRIKDTKEYIDAELVAARIAACFAIFIRQNPSGMIGRLDKNSDNQPLETIEPGMITYLNNGEDVVEAKPDHPATTAGEFVALQQRLAAAGLGQSYELISRDLSKVSYSSVRQGHLEDRKSFEIFQSHLVQHLCRPVWEAFVQAAVLGGAVKIPDFSRNPERYTGARWITPGWQWVDPLKEVNASSAALDIGASTLEEICGQKGLDWQEVLKQRAREKTYAESLGLDLNAVDGIPAAEPENEGEEGNNAGQQE